MANKLSIAALFSGVLYLILVAAVPVFKPQPVALKYPGSWPKPIYNFDKNRLTKAGVELGRQLFYDPVLSKDSTVSCSSCHLSFTAFAHVDHALSHGIADRIGTRNAPALMNLAWAGSFMWDGAVNHLDVQALAQFELTLVSANAKYDRVMAGNDSFTVQEQSGYRLFQTNCARCHAEPFFTNYQFERNGLPPDTTLNDYGRGAITKQPQDSLKFKVPTLRNIEYSYPYMHDGRFRNLQEVLKHYARADSLGIALSSNERVDLVAFLLTLTDKEFLFNPEFAFPRK